MTTIDRTALEKALACYAFAAPEVNFDMILAAARAHLESLPKVKTVNVWHVEWADGSIPLIDYPYMSKEEAEAAAVKRLAHSRYQCVRVTGPHQQEIPCE